MTLPLAWMGDERATASLWDDKSEVGAYLAARGRMWARESLSAALRRDRFLQRRLDASLRGEIAHDAFMTTLLRLLRGRATDGAFYRFESVENLDRWMRRSIRGAIRTALAPYRRFDSLDERSGLVPPDPATVEGPVLVGELARSTVDRFAKHLSRCPGQSRFLNRLRAVHAELFGDAGDIELVSFLDKGFRHQPRVTSGLATRGYRINTCHVYARRLRQSWNGFRQTLSESAVKSA